MIAKGGKSIYGARLGILMLEAQFPRIFGDMGNANTWPFPVHYKVVKDATPEKVVRQGAEGLLPKFIQSAQELVEEGVDGITTNCGFLSLFQSQLQQAVSVPVMTSSLMQVEMVNKILPEGKRAGILTISASTLTLAHLAAANVPENTPIGTTEGGGEFTQAILNNAMTLDVQMARKDNVQAAALLAKQNKDLGAIVLECTNMSPYAFDISQETGLPVFSIYEFATWFHAGLSPRKFDNNH